MNDAPSNSDTEPPGASDSNEGKRRRGSPTESREVSDQAVVAASLDHPTPPNGYEETLSIWPAVVAAGITLTAFGLVTNVSFSIFGILVFSGGIIRWAGELIRE